MTEINQTIRSTLIAHKGEVIVVYDPAVINIFYAPQAAREFAQALINAAEAAEQQMDAERSD